MAPRTTRVRRIPTGGARPPRFATLRRGALIPDLIPGLIRALVTSGRSPQDHPSCSILDHVVQEARYGVVVAGAPVRAF
jgi:hypothetical protein